MITIRYRKEVMTKMKTIRQIYDEAWYRMARLQEIALHTKLGNTRIIECLIVEQWELIEKLQIQLGINKPPDLSIEG